MTPRIENVSIAGRAVLRVKWKGAAPPVDVDLTGWIATGGEVLAVLTDKEIFSKAAVSNYGSAIMWDGGKFAIDATHLMRLANEQGHSAIP